MEFEPVIGLEVHVELLTKTKAFCGCSAEFGGEPNTRVCPTCLGLPGALPRLNKKVIEYGIKAGIALNCSINKKTRMDRKNYFYPDAPKNYQITQQDSPLCTDGYIKIRVGSEEKIVGIDRIHIEEDAGKLIHSEAGTLVDFNRAGVPLIEIVSKAEMRSSKEAVQYLTELRKILQAIHISDCKMEEGSLRCDANISIRLKGTSELGIKCEIKNMNSFKFLEKALDYEFNRQAEAISNGEELHQETRRWDEKTSKTIVMRSKEEANDYRYFPEGDLTSINISSQWIEDAKASIPELPFEREERFIRDYKVTKYEAEILTSSTAIGDFFEKTIDLCKDPKNAANWIIGDFLKLINKKNVEINRTKITPKALGQLIILINEGVISNVIGKKVLEEMFNTGWEPFEIVEQKGWKQNNDEEELLKIVKEVLNRNVENVLEYKKGKRKLLGYFVGEVMKETKGRGNPQIVNEIIAKELLD